MNKLKEQDYVKLKNGSNIIDGSIQVERNVTLFTRDTATVYVKSKIARINQIKEQWWRFDGQRRIQVIVYIACKPVTKWYHEDDLELCTKEEYQEYYRSNVDTTNDLLAKGWR